MAHFAALFDLDGTLAHNMPFHVQAWMALCRRHGLQGRAEQFERELAGKKNDEILPLLLGRSASPEELQSLAAEKEQTYRSLYAPHLALLPGARELLTRLREHGVRLAIASAAPPENRQLVLGGLALHGCFDAVVGAEAVKRGKPFPDLFLEAARQLDTPPERCLVFEDAHNGVLAARAAGMPVVGLTTTVEAEALCAAGALAAIPDFTKLPAAVEALLFAR